MPSFTTSFPNLHAAGPLIELRLAVGFAAEKTFRAANQPIPMPVPLTAMVDTGATGSVIRQGLAAQLGLHPISMTKIHTPSSTNVACPVYLMRLLLPNNVTIETKIIEAPLQGQHIQGLIGRDVLSQGVLVYIGYANLFSLSF